MKRTSESGPRRMVVAMVLGSALSAFGAPSVLAAPKTVNDMSRYCTACWRNARLPADCWSDCTQDVFVRMMERVPVDAWDRALKLEGDERREFVRAIDAVKKRVQRSRHYTGYPEGGVADPTADNDRMEAEQREAIARAAEKVLSPRQRTILDDTISGYSVPEIAERLAIAPERVSDEKYKAIRKLREVLPAAF
jgi:RNA polymerase sigma factor (sigma-70 family)